MPFYAEDIMSPKPITVRPDMRCEEVVDIPVSDKITGAPVTDADGLLIGMISVMDILASTGVSMPYAVNDFEKAEIDRILAEEGLHVESVTEGYVSEYYGAQCFYRRPRHPGRGTGPPDVRAPDPPSGHSQAQRADPHRYRQHLRPAQGPGREGPSGNHDSRDPLRVSTRIKKRFKLLRGY